jgi:hypothetical protein
MEIGAFFILGIVLGVVLGGGFLLYGVAMKLRHEKLHRREDKLEVNRLTASVPSTSAWPTSSGVASSPTAEPDRELRPRAQANRGADSRVTSIVITMPRAPLRQAFTQGTCP